MLAHFAEECEAGVDGGCRVCVKASDLLEAHAHECDQGACDVLVCCALRDQAVSDEEAPVATGGGSPDGETGDVAVPGGGGWASCKGKGKCRSGALCGC